MMDRRIFLQGALGVGAALPWALRSSPVRAAQAQHRVTTLGPNLYLLEGFGGNVTVFDSTDGVLLVDGGAPEHSAAVLNAVRELTGKSQVHTLFNTHWHWDQTGSNAPLGATGTRIIAHENTRLWLSTDVDSKWENRKYGRLPAKARPSKTFYTAEQLDLGGEQIEYGHLFQAHTDGDIFVHFRRANVLVAGDVLAVGRYPVIDYITGGWIGGMATAAQQLAARCDDSTRVIPGVGPVQARADLAAEQAMLVDVRARLSKLLAQGMSIQDMLEAAPTRDLDAKWGDPKLFIANTWHGLIRRTGELGVSIV
ncbi:MAG: MBL fold metallo-hydrolase [Proteobacteria bacterium]|jgi:cyclase|nr:MBL fold metallo-hydrolase [Pseudomonadota bacterium]